MSSVNKKLILVTMITSLSLVSLSGCSSKRSPKFKKYTGPVPTHYKVRRGDTVSKIAYRYGLDWRDVARLNDLDGSYTVYVGQRLRLKSGSTQVKTRKTPKRSTPTTSRPQTTTYSPPKVSNKSWFRPTTGTVFQQFDLSKNIKGMRFSGDIGSPVFASQSGQVIYANNGLVEYGNLILIRHSGDFITAYAHNDKLMVKEGDRVRKGNQIATMGSSGADKVMLEFQVRKGGKAIDPRKVLN